MALPELDVARIKRWCDAKIPEHLWDQLKIEVDVASHHATIVEVRPSSRGEGGADSLPGCTVAVHPVHGAVESVLA